jgi:hypothetical protein
MIYYLISNIYNYFFYSGRLYTEAFKRAAQAREHLKGKSVVVIQKVARGRIGRRRFRDCKHAARMVQYAVYVQVNPPINMVDVYITPWYVHLTPLFVYFPLSRGTTAAAWLSISCRH